MEEHLRVTNLHLYAHPPSSLAMLALLPPRSFPPSPDLRGSMAVAGCVRPSSLVAPALLHPAPPPCRPSSHPSLAGSTWGHGGGEGGGPCVAIAATKVVGPWWLRQVPHGAMTIRPSSSPAGTPLLAAAALLVTAEGSSRRSSSRYSIWSSSLEAAT